MAIQPCDLRKLEPWADFQGEEEIKKLVDEIEPRIDKALKRIYNFIPDNNVWLVRCPEASNSLVLKEIKRRYHGWDIKTTGTMKCFKDDIIFYPKRGA